MSAFHVLPGIIVIFALTLSFKDFWQQLLPKLLSDKAFQHFLFFVMLAIFFLWSAQASTKEYLSIHLLGLTTLTLLLGWRSAFVITIIPVTGLCLTLQLPFNQFFIYLLLSSLIPILISHAVFWLSFRFLPKNIFVYIFVAGFFAGGITSSIHFLVNSLFYLWQGSYDWKTINDNYLLFLPLLIFPEGLLNGMAAAIMSVFKPEWLRTFSDKHYLYPTKK